MHYVYILQSAQDKSFYTGSTEDLVKRIEEHNRGQATYSSSKRPWSLYWYCVFSSKKKALLFEEYLKTGSGIAFRNRHILQS